MYCVEMKTKEIIWWPSCLIVINMSLPIPVTVSLWSLPINKVKKTNLYWFLVGGDQLIATKNSQLKEACDEC